MKKFSVFLIFILISTTAFAGYREDLLNKMDSINTFNYKALGGAKRYQQYLDISQSLYDKGNKTAACRQAVEAFQAPLKRMIRLTPPVYRAEVLTPVIQPLSENKAKIILSQIDEHDKFISAKENMRVEKDLPEFQAFKEAIATQATSVLQLPKSDVLLPVKECGFGAK